MLYQAQCGKELVVAYTAHAPTKAERTYSTTRKELATEHFVTFLYRQFFLASTGYCHVWAIKVCVAVKGMVFKQLTLG